LNVYKATADNITYSNATIAFYSIGSATDLALLDARVSTLMADLRAIEEAGFDRDAIAYIRAVEEADGAYLETSVKTAINNLVSGLKSDGLWESMASTCLLCGPRTLAGALVPLRGDAPTSYGFVEGDFDRSNGITGDGTSYLDSNRANDADPQNDKHNAGFLTSISGVAAVFGSGVTVAANYDYIDFFEGTRVGSRSASNQTGITPVAGMQSVSRNNAANFQYRCSGTSGTLARESVTPDSQNVLILARNSDPVSSISQHTIAFYSIGTSLDLAKLDSHVSAYVTAIGAAL